MELKKLCKKKKIAVYSIPQPTVLFINSLLNLLIKQRYMKCATYLTKRHKKSN